MMSKIRSSFSYSWTVVIVLWVVSMLNYLDRLMMASMREPIVESIPMTDKQFGWLMTIFLIVYAVLSPLGGYFADRFSRKIVIVFSLLVWSVITLWTGFVHSYEEMLLARGFMGISEACYIPASVAMVMDYHKGKTRSLASGILMSGLYAGMALGGASGYIAEFWGWRFGFQLFGVIGILYSIVLWFVLEDIPKEQRFEKQNEGENIFDKGISDMLKIIKNLFKSFSYRILVVYGILLGMTFWVIYIWTPTYFKDGFHLSLGKAGVSAMVFFQIASFIGVIVGGIIADRWSRSHIKGRIFVPAIGFIVGGPFLFLMSTTDALFVAILCMVVFGLAKGFHDANYMPVMCQVVDQRFQAMGYGIMSFFSVLAGGLMTWVGGALRDAGSSLSIAFQISALGVLISGLILFTIKPKSNGI